MQLSDKERRLIRAVRYNQKYKTMWLAWLIIGSSAVGWQVSFILQFRDMTSDSPEDRLAFLGFVIAAIISGIGVSFFLVTTWRGDRKTRLLLKLVDEKESHHA
jgi:hypothetical protein